MPQTYESIATQTLSPTATTVTFSSIPSTYTDLVVVCAYNRVSGGNNISMRLNGDTTNYSETYIEGDGTNVVSGRNANDSNMRIAFIVGGTGTSQSTMIINLQNYSNTTTYKTVLTRYSEGSTGVGASVGLWRSTASINSVEIGCAGINFATGSTFTLYGIAAA